MRRLSLFVLVVLLLVAGGAGFLGYIGYFGGRLFTTVAARRIAPAAERGVAVVIFSGDMGFRVGMAPKVAARLSATGLPVIGVNSLVYYRKRRTPEEATALIERAMRKALALPGVGHVVLIGQSFGADMLHVGLVTLDPALRARIAFVAMVVPGDTVDFQASPSEVFSWRQPDAAALPTARMLTWVPALCIWGAEETDSLCPLLALPNVGRVKLPGDHYLDSDPDRLAATIRIAIARALAPHATGQGAPRPS